MKPYRMGILVFSVALCVFVGLLVLGGDVGGGVVFEFLSLPEYADTLNMSERRSRELDVEGEEVRKRLDRKAQFVEELIEGRRTLLETAQRFQELDREVPQRGTDWRPIPLGAKTEEEGYCIA